ncbi:MAG: response regulator [Deltaproteobacteria bacterium]|nr:response regulator [Deltaproteobacteria bacterium]
MEIDTKKVSVLVVDDEHLIVSLIKDCLEMEGYTVFEAMDGNTGLEIFKDKRPHIVIMDVKMPGMDGIKLKALIKEIDSNAKIIMMSGHIEAVDRHKDSKDIFLKKPFNLKDLILTLKDIEGRL